MATIGFQLAYGNPHIVHVPECQTHSSFTPGDLVWLTNGYLQLAANVTTIFGVVQANTVGTTGNPTPVHVISPEDVFIAEMDTTSTTTYLGDDFGVEIGTPGSMNVATGSSDVVSVIDFFEPVGTALGKVLVKFRGTLLQGTWGDTS